MTGLADEPRAEPSQRLEARDGASATLERNPQGETLVLRDAGGRLLVEHDAATGRTVVHVPAGELRVEAAGDIHVRAARRLTLEAGDALTLEAPELTARAARARLLADDASLVARAVAATADHLVVAASALEVQATQLVERARDVFREAEGLAQTTAGRMRVLVRGTYQLLGKRAHLEAEEDVKVDGQRIHLG
jgi:hypothetical protein